MTQRTRAPLSGKTYAKRFERINWDPGLRERKTITDYLASALRAAIYDGQFADNEELNQVELAQHFNVSRVPIREALRQLQAEGLVQSIAHHRTIVSGMTTAQILEAIEMRAVLEAFLLEKSAKRFTKDDIDRLRQLCKETDKIKDYGPRWVVKNWEFHRALYAPSECGTIISAVERIHLNIERYARRAGSSKRLQQAANEHRLILRAVEEGNFTRASELLQEHILHTGAAVRQQREQSNSTTENPVPRSRRRPAAARNYR